MQLDDEKESNGWGKDVLFALVGGLIIGLLVYLFA
jgi:hypothetical protein